MIGSDGGSVGRAVASNTRNSWFESQQWQILSTNCKFKKKRKEKEAGNGPSLKKIRSMTHYWEDTKAQHPAWTHDLLIMRCVLCHNAFSLQVLPRTSTCLRSTSASTSRTWCPATWTPACRRSGQIPSPIQSHLPLMTELTHRWKYCFKFYWWKWALGDNRHLIDMTTFQEYLFLVTRSLSAWNPTNLN